MTLEEEWARVDKESLRLMKKEAMKSHCPGHVWIEGELSSHRYLYATCLICGLHRKKKSNQYKYRYGKKGKHRQEDVNKRWEMYNQGIDLIEYDKHKFRKLVEKYQQ